MTVVNPSDKAITLKRNCKLADVSPCLAVEDFDTFQGLHAVAGEQESVSGKQHTDGSFAACRDAGLASNLSDLGLDDIDLDSCLVSELCKSSLLQLLIEYEDIFSKHPLDWGEVEGYMHCIHLVDDRPLRFPYRRVPPAHNQKLRQVLTDMEEWGIIRKSSSDFASPLVMVLKKMVGCGFAMISGG